MKKTYPPLTRSLELGACELILKSSYVRVGGTTDRFDARERDSGWSRDNGDDESATAPWDQ